jgi:hypothetical protein
MRFLAAEGEGSMRKSAVALLILAALAVLGCQTITEDLPESQQSGGNNPAVANPIPVVVVPIPLPTPVVATPPPANNPQNPNPNPNNPNPAPTNQPSNPDNGGGDVPTNTNPVAKLTAKLYFIENFGHEVDPPACVGCRIHLDVTPTDERNQHTQARGTPRWTYSNTSIINITGNSPYNPVLEARDTGDLDAYAEVDGVRSNTVHISIR